MSATYTHRQLVTAKELFNKPHPATGAFLRELCEVTSQKTMSHLGNPTICFINYELSNQITIKFHNTRPIEY